MTVTVGGTTITFNDATTQTTAPVNTNANVNSITAGTGISVSSSTGAVTITNTGGSGTVTSVATGNGLSGGTITTSGTLVVACPSYNSVGSYATVDILQNNGAGAISSGSNYAAGSGNLQLLAQVGGAADTNNLSGTWKWMGGPVGANVSGCPRNFQTIACRVS